MIKKRWKSVKKSLITASSKIVRLCIAYWIIETLTPMIDIDAFNATVRLIEYLTT